MGVPTTRWQMDSSDPRYPVVQQLIAYWLDIEPADMPWQPDESRVIVWTTQAAYERELGAITEQQRLKMLDTFERLHDRELLEPVPDPRVVVRVQCGIEPCPIGQPGEEPLSLP